MKYAVIKTGGKQYKVSEGDVLQVEKLENDGKNVTFSEVLMVSDDGKVQIGTPTLPGLSVSATVNGDVKGEKIRVAKYKAKVRYRRVTGHRQSLTSVTIASIGGKTAKKSETVQAEKAPSKPRAKRTVKAEQI